MNKENPLLEEAIKIFKILGSETRLNILLLLEKKDMTVTDLFNELEVSQPAISKQLAILKEYKIISYDKKGVENIYKLNDFHILNVINSTIGHTEHVLNNQDCDNNA